MQNIKKYIWIVTLLVCIELIIGGFIAFKGTVFNIPSTSKAPLNIEYVRYTPDKKSVNYEVCTAENEVIYCLKGSKQEMGPRVMSANESMYMVVEVADAVEPPYDLVKNWIISKKKAVTLQQSENADANIQTRQVMLPDGYAACIRYYVRQQTGDFVPVLNVLRLIELSDGNYISVYMHNESMIDSYDQIRFSELLQEGLDLYAIPWCASDLMSLSALSDGYLLQQKSVYTLEKYFEFNSDTGTILEYRSKDLGAPVDVIVPEYISGVAVKHIGSEAFYKYNDMNTLKSVILPEGLETIDKNAFLACTHLKSVYIPSTVTDIGESAFQGCTSLTDIRLPNNLRELNPKVFKDCTALQFIRCANTDISIAENAMQNCNAQVMGDEE